MIYGERYELDSGELRALIAEYGSNTRLGRERRVVYLPGLLEVTFKSGESRILEVGPASARNSWVARQLQEQIEAELMADSVDDATAQSWIMAWSSDLDALSKPFVVGVAERFQLRSEPATGAHEALAGHPCELTVGYRSSEILTLDTFRQGREVLRWKYLLAIRRSPPPAPDVCGVSGASISYPRSAFSFDSGLEGRCGHVAFSCASAALAKMIRAVRSGTSRWRATGSRLPSARRHISRFPPWRTNTVPSRDSACSIPLLHDSRHRRPCLGGVDEVERPEDLERADRWPPICRPKSRER